MPHVRVGDISMYYVEAGVGEPLVLIMGLGADHLAWGFQFPAFAERYRVIAFDNRGAGQRVAALRAPTLISVADQDILVPPRFSRALAERIPGAELRIIENAGHGYFWERPDMFNQMCLDFLTDVGGSDRRSTPTPPTDF